MTIPNIMSWPTRRHKWVEFLHHQLASVPSFQASQNAWISPSFRSLASVFWRVPWQFWRLKWKPKYMFLFLLPKSDIYINSIYIMIGCIYIYRYKYIMIRYIYRYLCHYIIYIYTYFSTVLNAPAKRFFFFFRWQKFPWTIFLLGNLRGFFFERDVDSWLTLGIWCQRKVKKQMQRPTGSKETTSLWTAGNHGKTVHHHSYQFLAVPCTNCFFLANEYLNSVCSPFSRPEYLHFFPTFCSPQIFKNSPKLP